ncbi:MAG: MarR family transcriptional regulator [Bacteroidia bacterium]|nr:MarR family transcriptional regulator [Bacteroidia bacterium]
MSKLFPEANAILLENTINELVLAFNVKRQNLLGHYGVSELEVDIIEFLQNHEQKKMKEVGEHFNIKLSTLTSTIDKLEKLKLVKRKNSKDDRRVIYIKPTAKGGSLLADVNSPARSIADSMAKEMNKSEFDVVQKSVTRMLELAKN